MDSLVAGTNHRSSDTATPTPLDLHPLLRARRARTHSRSLEPAALVLALSAVALVGAVPALGRRRRLVIRALVVVVLVVLALGIHGVGKGLVVGVTLFAHGGLLRLEDSLLGRSLRAALPGLGDELGELILVARLLLVALLRLRLRALGLLLRGLLRLQHHLACSAAASAP